MRNPGKASGWAADELRTRFVPKSRIRNGLVSVAPWLDILLLFVFVLLLESRLVLQPGVVVELPASAAVSGEETEMVAVLRVMDGPKGRAEIVFFDDEPYEVNDASRMNALMAALAEHRRTHGYLTLTLFADKAAEHGTLTKLIQMARDVGLQRVNLATEQEDAG
jgi:biopolymer transport protein ExbD